MSNEIEQKDPREEVITADTESIELAEILEPDFEAEEQEEEILDDAQTKRDYEGELIEIIRSNDSPRKIKEKLEDYHENDIAKILETITPQERRKIYRLLDTEFLSDVFEYADEEYVVTFLGEMDIKKAAAILSLMETDTATTILRGIEKQRRSLLIDLLDDETKANIAIIASFDEDEIGSKMSTNYICISDNVSVKGAMHSLVEQAEKNDNISTIFVVDESGVFYGAIDLKELIIAREGNDIHDIIITSFPYVYGSETVDECIEKLKSYSENSIPVLDNSNRILGVITSQSIVEVIDEEMGDDYAKFAGLTSEEDLNEPVITSLGKRLPWLLILLAFGIVISSVVGIFTDLVVAAIPIVIAFQSLILDMAGNSGTQSLAVTIRVLTDETVDGKQKFRLVFKEARVGFCNGLLIGTLAFGVLGLYLKLAKAQTWGTSFLISGCAGIALVLAMTIASLVGTVVPLLFKKLKVDPAVASGPLITSINDLVAVVTFYGLCYIFLIQVFGMGGIV